MRASQAEIVELGRNATTPRAVARGVALRGMRGDYRKNAMYPPCLSVGNAPAGTGAVVTLFHHA